MLKTIDELITALESGVYAKATGQFEVTTVDVQKDMDEGVKYELGNGEGSPVGYCCLGVYNEICMLRYSRTSCIFGWAGQGNAIAPSKTALPAGHFLTELITVPAFSAVDDERKKQFQQYLADINDITEDFSHVVRALKEFKAGIRVFPSHDDFVAIDEHD